MLLNITNGGLTTSTQDTQITLHSLMNLNNIHTIFNQYEEWTDFELAFMPDSESPTLSPTRPFRESVAMDVRVPVSRVANVYENEENKVPDQNQSESEIRVQAPLSVDIVNELQRENQDAEEDKILEENQSVYVGGFTEQALHELLERVFKQTLAAECVDKKTPKRNLTQAEAKMKIDDSENDVLSGKQWVKDTSCGLKFIDEEFLSKQKKVLGYFLKTMGKNFWEGKSIMSVSMPITLFSSESMLTKFAATLAFAPNILPTAGQQKTPLEALQYVIAFFFSTLHMGIAQVKPFNPIIGIHTL